MATEEKLVDSLKKVAADLHDTRRRLREVEERYQEPVAVVGMACRFPGGVGSPEGLWDLVVSGGDAVGGFPGDRGWDVEGLFHPDPDHPGTCYVRSGGFVEGADRFDAGFFGISPREALAASPQQRQLLEVSWELLERAGIEPGTLKGTPTGVYVGTATTGSAAGSPAQSRETEGYAGNAPSVLSGRIAYTLGLEGPAVTIETACSSSLVAMHLACQSLRQGESTMALAGGVTVMATPEVFTGFSRQRGLAADGRCKPFAAAADGTGWGEGVGLVLLERLSDARRNGRRVLAVIRGSAVNQDGASNGLTAPNGPSQERVIGRALASAGLSASEVDVVEAHGTGTTLGDPIEANALLATYGRGRASDRPLWLGSVKSNIGHTQGAAGVAGVIKMIMAMRHGVLPASLHIDEPTPHVDWSTGVIRLATERTAWPETDRPRRAGISSFGISGTNAHVIVEQAPEAEEETAVPAGAGGVVPWVLSGRGEQALRDQAGRLAERVAADPGLDPADVAWSLATTRTAFDTRAVVIGQDLAELTAGLEALASGRPASNVVCGRAGDTVNGRGPVLVFPGQGSQWAGMGARLLEESEVFAARIAECERALARYVDWSLTGMLRDPAGTGLSRVEVVQPVLWAVMVSLAAVWAEHGVTPAAVVGHSQGEIAAACVAGAVTLEDAAAIVALRSRALAALAGSGAMASLGAGEEQATGLIAGREGVVVAAVNGPGSVVVSGPPDAVADVVAAAHGQGFRGRLIEVDYASHGPHIDTITDRLAADLDGIRPAGRADTAFYSTVTGQVHDPATLDAGYWITNLRRPVRFHQAVQTLVADGYRTFIEVAPHPVLTPAIQETPGLTTIPTLRRDHDDHVQVLHALAHAHTAGIDIDWTPRFPTTPRTIDLPTYPFQQQRYWMTSGAGGADAAGLGLKPVDHPLLGASVERVDGDGHVITGRLAKHTSPWLGEHAVSGTTLVPGTVMVELALRAADEVGCGAVQELALRTPLVLPESGELPIQVIVGPSDEEGRHEAEIYSRTEAGTEWVCHASGRLVPEPVTRSEDLRPWPPVGAESLDVDDVYERAASLGYEYGPAFRGLRAAWRQGTDLLAEVELPEAAGSADGFGIHPVLLDNVLHAVLLTGDIEDERVRLPFAWNGVSLHAVGATTVRVRLSQEEREGGRGLRVAVADPTGAPVLDADSVEMRPADTKRLRTAAIGQGTGGLHSLNWTPWTRAATEEAPWTIHGPYELALPDEETLAGAQGEQEAVVVTVPGLAEGADAAAGTFSILERTLGVVRSWLAEPRYEDARLVLVTRGAVTVGDLEEAGGADLAGAAVQGLVRSAETEAPGRFVLLDLGLEEHSSTDDLLEAVRGALSTGEPQIVLRGDRLLVGRLGRPVAEAPRGGGDVLDEDDTVLITGGTGMLGGLVAEHLVRDHGARRLLLLSRQGPEAPNAADLCERLSALGAHVDVTAVDVADGRALAQVLSAIPSDHPLGGVVHAAGALDDGVVVSQDAERLRRVWDPKALGGWNLHLLTRDVPLKFFVLFSSAAGVVGSAGQSGYAAANAFCDALATYRRAGGLSALSVAWGLWADPSAMTAHMTQADLARLRGMRPLPPERGLALLDAVLRRGESGLVAADIDLDSLRGDVLPAVLRDLATRTRPRAASAASGPALTTRLAGLEPAARAEVVTEVVRERVAAVLGYRSPNQVRAEENFQELGLDSLTALELRNRLSAASGLRLPATLAFDFPTPRALAEYLSGRLGGEHAPARAPRVVAADQDDLIAIVAMACRYPGGADSPERLWDLVASGRDAMGEFPAGRGWALDRLFHPDPDHPGTSYAREGGFVHGADAFDAEFFGISPREAVACDPQQRLLLETAWELVERAGIPPGSLKGTPTGVYAGVMYHDYASGRGDGDATLEGYVMSGSGSVVAGRVAYTLGLEGPAVTVDTACSSSLVAMHLACQSLRQGESDLALAGGVTVMATPAVFTGFSRQRGLAPDGRCKPFAAAADGTGWGEGVGLVLLERLSDARRNGHRVLAVIRGSAVNQDGASNGLTAPNGPSQERVIGQALASAGLSASEVDVVEAHGTGTTLGDPIEANALLATYGRGRASDRPLWLGSVKSNIGHTQAAAGIAGVIKMVMAMRHGVLPASLHIDEPTPHADWSTGAVQLLTEPTEWKATDRRRRAGVSSFGASGTNAHLILEQGTEVEEPTEPDDPADVVPWVLSGRGEQALRDQAGRLAEKLAAEPDLSPSDVAWSLATTRTAFDTRAVVIGQDLAELTAGLEALAGGRPASNVVCGRAGDTVNGRGPVLVFPGQGSQWAGMGARLLDESEVFAARIAECEHALARYVDWSLTGMLRDPAGTGLGRVEVVQPVLWAVMVSLAAVWAEHGVTPAAVVGHSQGEIAAACVAGAVTLEDAAAIVALRSRALAALAGSGAMASLGAGEEQATGLIAGREGVVVAAVNGPGSVVVSGPPDAVADVVAAAHGQGFRGRLIEVDYASHGPHIDTITERLAADLEGIGATGRADTAFYSTVTGRAHDPATLDAGYWITNLRRPVRFHHAVQALAADGYRTFIEVAPHPVLTPAIQETPGLTTIPTLRRDHDDHVQVLHALAHAHTTGIDIDWTPRFPTTPRTIDLPTYPFQQQRYWLASGGAEANVEAAGLTRVGHALLPAAVRLADGGLLMSGRISADGSWLSEHTVGEAVLLPGAALVEWALRAADEAGCGTVEELTLRSPLVLPESGGLRIQVAVGAASDDGRREVLVHSQPDHEGDGGWVCHAVGALGPLAAVQDSGPDGVWPPPGATRLPIEGFYKRIAAAGYGYGPAFQGLRAVWRDGADLLAEVELPEVAGDTDGFGIHPALLDAALHPALVVALNEEASGDGQVWLPFTWSGVTLRANGANRVRVRLVPIEGDGHALRVQITDVAGAPVLNVESVEMRPADMARLATRAGQPAEGLFALDWNPVPVPLTGTKASDEDVWAFLGHGTPPVAGAVGYPNLEALRAATATGSRTPSVVFTEVSGGPDDGGLAVVEDLLGLLQGWLAEPHLAVARLVIITRGAVCDEDGTDAAAAAVWGLVRSAQSEHPDRFVLLDVDRCSDDVAAAVRYAIDQDEPQLAIREGRLLVPRLARADGSRALLPPPGERAWRLDIVGTATPDNLTAVPCPEVLEPLAPGQVRIEVRAAGINLRDVLVSLGMVPGQTGLGGEGAGVVTEVAAGVTGLSVGDRVMGVFGGSFGPAVVADARMVTTFPDEWSFRQAAAVPIAFLTAWFGLVDLAGLHKDETVLIHAATGGVGTAAVQIARHLGARVYGTASPAKHAVLDDMGIDAEHRASSRDLDFEAAFRAATNGQGVDVVLNSLAGPFADASLRSLGRGGRFLEMGKTDIRDPEQVAADHPSVLYRAYDLITDAGPDRIGAMLGTLGELFGAGTLRPPPVRAWPLGRAREAFRYMSQARHVGKLVLDVPAVFDPAGTVLITGGTGTVAGAAAEHLVRVWRVRHLLLASRRGTDAPGAAELVVRLEELGADVRVVAADVADPAAVDRLLAGIDVGHPLTGVIHAAGLLDDATITEQSVDRLARVWRSKAAGAAHLRAATAHLRLGLFMVFSSAAATLGSPGQSTYAAANAYCDALAAQSRADGTPALSVAWGLWEESSGMTGHLDDADLARMTRMGVKAMSTAHGLALLDAAVRLGAPHVVAADLDLRALAGQPTLPAPLRGLLSGGAERPTAARPTDGWADRLTPLPPDEQLRVLADLVREHAAAVLGHAGGDALRTDVPFKELGFDSLTAVELRNRLSAATGLRLQATLVFQYPTPAALADHLRAELCPAEESPSAFLFSRLDGIESALDGLADRETRGRLAQRLEALLWRLGDGEEPALPGDALETASDAEMFDLIDRELGS